VTGARKQLLSRKIVYMCSLARARAVLPIDAKAAILKERWDTERAKKADMLKKT